jgi:hypothetical protein
MFLAIINDTYSEVKAEISFHRNEFELSDYFKGIANSIKGVCGKRDRDIDDEAAAKLALSDGEVTEKELHHNLTL